MLFIPLFATKTLGTSWASLIFCILGSITITLALWPCFYNTWKTKNTKDLPIGLFSLLLLAGILMTIGSICGISNTGAALLDSRSYLFVYLSVIVLLISVYTTGLALWNKRKEKDTNQKSKS